MPRNPAGPRPDHHWPLIRRRSRLRPTSRLCRPHRQVLAEASVVVTHAGHGTVLKALAAGVPLVCVPMGRDQKDNTVRVLRLGAGVRISKKATPHQIAAAVSEVLAESHYASAARRFAATLAWEAANVPIAADEAEGLLDRARPG